MTKRNEEDVKDEEVTLSEVLPLESGPWYWHKEDPLVLFFVISLLR